MDRKMITFAPQLIPGEYLINTRFAEIAHLQK